MADERVKKFFIPKINPTGLVLSAARAAGEVAATLVANARLNSARPNPYTISTDIIKDPELYKSDLGTSVYDDITFESVTYIDTEGTQQTTPSITLYTILIDVVFPRNVIKTEIQGRNGTVKEYIGEGDAQLVFRGIITGANGTYPTDEVEDLKNLIKAPVAIPISCTYLNNLDVDTIVFEDRTLGQEEGGHSYQTFSLNAVSDTPQELLIYGL